MTPIGALALLALVACTCSDPRDETSIQLDIYAKKQLNSANVLSFFKNGLAASAISHLKQKAATTSNLTTKKRSSLLCSILQRMNFTTLSFPSKDGEGSCILKIRVNDLFKTGPTQTHGYVGNNSKTTYNLKQRENTTVSKTTLHSNSSNLHVIGSARSSVRPYLLKAIYATRSTQPPRVLSSSNIRIISTNEPRKTSNGHYSWRSTTPTTRYLRSTPRNLRKSTRYSGTTTKDPYPARSTSYPWKTNHASTNPRQTTTRRPYPMESTTRRPFTSKVRSDSWQWETTRRPDPWKWTTDWFDPWEPPTFPTFDRWEPPTFPTFDRWEPPTFPTFGPWEPPTFPTFGPWDPPTLPPFIVRRRASSFQPVYFVVIAGVFVGGSALAIILRVCVLKCGAASRRPSEEVFLHFPPPPPPPLQLGDPVSGIDKPPDYFAVTQRDGVVNQGFAGGAYLPVAIHGGVAPPPYAAVAPAHQGARPDLGLDDPGFDCTRGRDDAVKLNSHTSGISSGEVSEVMISLKSFKQTVIVLWERGPLEDKNWRKSVSPYDKGRPSVEINLVDTYFYERENRSQFNM